MSTYRMKYRIGSTEHHIPVSDDLQNIDLEDKFDLDSDWCYIYPNNGTAENPAKISRSSRYVTANPFPGYIVKCIAEVYYGSKWGETGWAFGTDNGGGVFVTQYDNGDIVIQTGNAYTITKSFVGGGPFQNSSHISDSLPCRVKVWKIGKIPT